MTTFGDSVAVKLNADQDSDIADTDPSLSSAGGVAKGQFVNGRGHSQLQITSEALIWSADHLPSAGEPNGLHQDARTLKRTQRPWKALLINSWVLAIAVGVLAVVLVGSSRLHSVGPLASTNVVTSMTPFIEELDQPLDFLYVILTVSTWKPTWEALSVDGGSDHSSRRRLTHAELYSEQLSALRYGKKKRQLMSSSVSSSEVPSVQVALMQRLLNSSVSSLDVSPSSAVVTPEEWGFEAVSDQIYFCQPASDTAVRCLIQFTSTNASYVAGEPTYLVISLNGTGQLPFQVESSELGWLGPAKNWIALGIILAMLVGIASERVHRMYCALLASFLMLGLLMWMDMTPDLVTVVSFVDAPTLGLLFGMMVLVGKLQDTGMFEVLCSGTLKLCGGRRWLLAVLMMYVTGFVSAFLDNVTTMLLMGPISMTMMHTMGQDPRPLLLAQALMSNIGGTATLVGDPPNIIIGNVLNIGFLDFIINLAPGVLLASVASVLLILLLYRGTLTGRIDNYANVLRAVSHYRIKDWDVFARVGFVSLVVIVSFLLHAVHHLDPAWFAVIGAVMAAVVTDPMEVDAVVKSVEWSMLLFFAAQFVMVEAAAEVGVIQMIASFLEGLVRKAPEAQQLLVAVEILLWASAVISALLDNIPYTITMVPVVQYMAVSLGLPLETLAWALSFGACFGGNATIIGASANIVTATMAEREGFHFTFLGWMYGGVPVMLVSVAVANAYMYVRYVM